MLEGLSTLNCPKKFAHDARNTFCVTKVKKLKILQRMYELISTFARNFETVESQILIA